MPLRLQRDGTLDNEDIPGVDRHYYENQIGPKSPFDDTYEFRLAAAIAKDKARHQLIRAVQKADEEARFNRGRLEEFADITNEVAFGTTRTIDGVEGAPDNAIKL
jgi:hypothetical protein